MSHWLEEALGREQIMAAKEAASRRRLYPIVARAIDDGSDDEIHFVLNAMELQLHDILEQGGSEVQRIASVAFQLARTLPAPNSPLERGQWYVRLACLGVIADRSADVRRILSHLLLSELTASASTWEERVRGTSYAIWLRLFRKKGWEDLDAVQEGVAELRRLQREQEPAFVQQARDAGDWRAAWRLIVAYHHARSAELLGTFTAQGQVDGKFDIREQFQAQLDRAVAAAVRGGLAEDEALSRLLYAAGVKLIEASIWTVTRAANSRVARFVEALVSRDRGTPIFEMLPPQRKTLREEGLLGSGYRSVVVSLPTSSGKTFIAEFRILQALNQFESERGWVAYVAPTRALVNQITIRLRQDFKPLGIVVEKVSPALEVDAIEAGLLTDESPQRQFRVLVATPEKLDLMLRTGWEEKIGRPLTLVVVDEAHGIASTGRGLKLELLLATINRECRNAQFLLLTPFIQNAREIAAWLAPESNKNVELGIDWVPNDRAVAIARPVPGPRRGDFWVELDTKHLSIPTLSVSDDLRFDKVRPLGLSWSDVSKGQGRLAAAVAHLLKVRGPVIILAGKPEWTWGIAQTLAVPENRASSLSDKLSLVANYLEAELGEGFPLIELLSYRIGVHHSGLPEDIRALMEWLIAAGELEVLVATTTIAQGVNFPVSGVVLASHQYPYGVDMPPEDFWNLAGRAGRVDQGDLGVVVLAATTPEKERQLEAFLRRAVGSLNSTLIEMVQEAVSLGRLLRLEQLAYEPRWSAFLQYLAHSYRLIGDHNRFAAEVEQVLRGTLGFQHLRRSHPSWADQLVKGVFNYAERIEGKPLQLVDGTGFSWESVHATLARLAEERIDGSVWQEPLFTPDNRHLRRLMGVLLEVPELREQLREAVGGPRPNGSKLAEMVSDWVSGASVSEMAARHFGGTEPKQIEKCCQSISGRLSQTAAWGLSALQVLTVRNLAELPLEEQLRIRNIPAKVYYGVSTDEAVLLRMSGVPRTAAERLAKELRVEPTDSLPSVRERLQRSTNSEWSNAVGSQGSVYRRVWTILEGIETPRDSEG